jgi:hypothetical protein
MDVTRKVTFYGERPAPSGALVQFLEEHGVQVEWTRPEEERSLGGDVNEVVVQMVATGGAVAIAAGVKKFRDMFRHARYRVEVEGEDQAEGNHVEPDDGGFLDG